MTRVAVLFGGISSEREISLSTGAGVIAALRARDFDVVPVDAGPDLGAIVRALTEPVRVDCVFNALHGRFGEDGAIQGVLDWLGIPYTHSGVRASALAMNKTAAKAVFRLAGLPVAESRLVSPEELAGADPLPLPYVVKPNSEGSSVGVSILRQGDNRRREIATGWTHGHEIIVEEFIPGREITVAVMGERALTVTEIIAAHDFYDYDAKYADGGSRHVLPAALGPEVALRAKAVAVAAHRSLGCSGASRADFRLDDTRAGEPRLVLLEVNTQPGMTPTSLLPEQAQFCGISYPELCAWMVENAGCRA